MHKSKLAGFIIDCQTTDLSDSAQFWGDALGMEIKRLPAQEGDKYIQLIDTKTNLHIEVQSVKHESRVHLDIETDNIEAEVKRLQALGATIVEYIHTWCVMQAPTGHKFCVVRKNSKEFNTHATQW